MSKTSETKKAQGYREKPDTCSNCQRYESELVEKSYHGFAGKTTWTEEKAKRCTLGGFAVKKTAVCDRHELKEAE